MNADSDLIQQIIDRATSDPEFLDQLLKHPQETAADEGFELSDEEALRLPDVVGSALGVGVPELVEELEPRISHISIPGEASHVPHLTEHRRDEEE